MKKIILLFAILIASCNAPVEEPKGSGAWAGDPEETFVVGSDEMTEMFTNFSQAHNDRDIEFIQFKRWLEKMYSEKTLELDYKSCEMISDDLWAKINEKYPGREVNIDVSEDGENGAHIEYDR